MKSHNPTTQRPRRKRRAADEAAASVAERAEAPGQSLETLRSPTLGAAERGRAALELQGVVGNAAVGRALAQRYPVNVPKDAGCDQVLDWMNSSNPYVPNWANTKADFSYSFDVAISGRPGKFSVQIINSNVAMIGPDVDMPEWRSSNPAMQAAWEDMYRRLRNHEGRHEAIAAKWEATLTERLAELGKRTMQIKANSLAEAEASVRASVAAKWAKWIASYQKDMRLIDPHTEILHCPVAEADVPEGGDDGSASAEA